MHKSTKQAFHLIAVLIFIEVLSVSSFATIKTPENTLLLIIVASILAVWGCVGFIILESDPEIEEL